MRWWLQTDSALFSVDNSVVKGMDFSSLTPDIWMVQWIDSRGEIERQDANGNNLNGLREVFIDVVPYCPLFQQFMRLLPGLLLPQAQKIQIELIGEVFDSKRQAPFHYTVAAGDYYWDATDATLFSSTAAGLQSAISTLNTLVDRVNSLVISINNVDAGIVTGVNAQMTTVNNGISAVGNSLVAQINAWIVDANNNSISTVNSYGSGLIDYINNTVLGNYVDGWQGANTINNRLQHVVNPDASPYGLSADIAHTGLSWSDPYTSSHVAPGTFSNVSGIGAGPISWTNVPHVAVANANWIPIGSTAPVNVTPAEQSAIMAGIAARTADLNVKKNTKASAVYAMTDIDDVIDYDVTTGW